MMPAEQPIDSTPMTPTTTISHCITRRRNLALVLFCNFERIGMFAVLGHIPHLVAAPAYTIYKYADVRLLQKWWQSWGNVRQGLQAQGADDNERRPRAAILT